MSEFKVGDRIKVIQVPSGHTYEEGSVGYVAVVDHDSILIVLEKYVGGWWTDAAFIIPTTGPTTPELPSYYQGEDGPDVIEVSFAWDLSPCEFNIVKYVKRHRQKNGLEDLKKARVYLDRLIEHEEKNNG